MMIAWNEMSNAKNMTPYQSDGEEGGCNNYSETSFNCYREGIYQGPGVKRNFWFHAMCARTE